MQLDRRSLLKGATALGGASLLSASTLSTAQAAYRPYPSRGSGGTFENRDGLGFRDVHGTQSYYHMRNAHVKGSGPYPLFIHLHGDGGYEYRNPNVWTTPQYLSIAKAVNGLFFVPRTPQTSQGYTWWQSYSSSQWLVNFINFEARYYNIDRRRIFLSGYSGGAQALAYNIIADYNNVLQGGGAMMLGGGGTQGMYISQTPSNSCRNNFLMRWHVGSLDDGSTSSDGFNALAASKVGYDTYTNAGWNTNRVIIPGEDHYESEDNGPSALRSLVNESQTKYGLPRI